MKEEYVKINRDSFIGLMILLREIVGEIPDIHTFKRNALYNMITNIETSVLPDREE